MGLRIVFSSELTGTYQTEFKEYQLKDVFWNLYPWNVVFHSGQFWDPYFIFYTPMIFHKLFITISLHKFLFMNISLKPFTTLSAKPVVVYVCMQTIQLLVSAAKILTN